MENNIIQRFFRSSVVLFAAAVLIGGCNKSEVETFESQNRIWFTQKISIKNEWIYLNEQEHSFALYPGKNSIKVPFQVNLMGDLADYDREFKVVAVDSLTTAVDSEYEVSSSVLRADQTIDTLWVRLIKSARLDNEEVKLTLYMAENENFAPGYSNSLQVTVSFSNKPVQPEWWTDEMSQIFLGPYSEKKFVALFTFATTEYGMEDLNDISEMAPSALRKLLLRFKDYIAKHDLTEADGSPIEIPIM
ncbi:DUF4843 domain-containing protein [Alistipes sp.]|uniref:DUF4843 domain-containing protein n=1 Tax=Alistipes sp. TaxID=1872444 RepID=UPI003AF06C30